LRETAQVPRIGRWCVSSLAGCLAGISRSALPGRGGTRNMPWREKLLPNSKCGLPTRSLPAPQPIVQFQVFDFAAQCVAVDPQHLGGPRLVPTAFIQDLLDKPSFKLAHRLLIADPAFNQLINEGIKLFVHGDSLVCKSSPRRVLPQFPRFLFFGWLSWLFPLIDGTFYDSVYTSKRYASGRIFWSGKRANSRSRQVLGERRFVTWSVGFSQPEKNLPSILESA